MKLLPPTQSAPCGRQRAGLSGDQGADVGENSSWDDWADCDVKAHKLDLHTFPGRLGISSYTGVRFTQHREVDWLYVWVVLRRCYYIEHTDVFM